MPSTPCRNDPRISWKPKALASRILPPALLEIFNKVTSKRHNVPLLNLPEVPSRLPQLLQLGLDQDHSNCLCAQFANAIRNVDETLLGTYHASAPQLCENVNPLITRSTCIEAFQQHLLLLRNEAIEKLSSTLLSQARIFVQESHLMQDSPSASNSSFSLSNNGAPSSKRKRQGRPSTFTPEQTFALNALLARDNQFSSEEKQFIAQELNLNRDQVNRWFCNARARKNTGARAASRGDSPASVRTVASDLTMSTESHQTDQSTNTPEVTSSSPGINDSSATPETTPGVFNSASPLHDATPKVDSLDVYLNYSACLQPEQGLFEPAHNLTPQPDQITNWLENVNMTNPVASSSSLVESQPVPTSVPNDTALFPESEGSNDQFLDSLNFGSILPLPTSPSSAPESHLPNNPFSDFDLSHW